MYEVGLVLTAGFGPGTREPSYSGIQRLMAADEEARNGRIQAAMIIGGNRMMGPTEAEAHASYAREHLPALARIIVLVDAGGMYTAEDIPLAAPKLDAHLKSVGESRRTTELSIPTYFKHFRRTKRLIKRLGFASPRWVDSGEKQIFTRLQEDAMYLLSLLDPFWKGWISRPFVRQARARYYEGTQ